VRVDTGVREGDAITVHYDPMIAKLIVWDEDRNAAVLRLQSALADYEIAGVQTNIGLLRRIAASADFMEADLDTGFLGRHPGLFPDAAASPPLAALAAAAARVLEDEAAFGRAASLARGDAFSPWSLANAWRMNGEGYQDFVLRHGEVEHAVRVFPVAEGAFDVQSGGVRVGVVRGGAELLYVDGVTCRAAVVRRDDTFLVVLDGVEWRLALKNPLGAEAVEAAGGDRLVAPMPGRIVSLHAAAGDRVSAGDVVLVLEAMKVQMRLAAPRDCVIEAIGVQAGDLVDEGAELARFVD
jgi:3-methylcrotonyl-CoA carboxylase alpha subunit